MKKRFLLDKRKRSSYYDILLRLFGSDVVAYWPMWEASGTVMYDLKNARNGSYSNITLNNAKSPISKNAPLFNGTSGYANGFSAGLAAAFNGAEGTYSFWFKASSTGVWLDNEYRYLLKLAVDANNAIDIYKHTNNSVIIVYKAGGTSEAFIMLPTFSEWCNITITWSSSADQVIIYRNGTQELTTSTGLGTWAGTIVKNVLGAVDAPGAFWFWDGWLSHAVILSRAATSAEIRQMVRMGGCKIMSFIGDSITADASSFYVKQLTEQCQGGKVNHATAGHSIMANMDAQVLATATDDPNVIIIALGTNDAAADPAALQAEAEENLAELKTMHPTAKIYWMNCLPRWTDVGGGTEYDLSVVRARIAAACTAQGVDCWDTYTTPWIVVGDTSDGVHPTAAGGLKIATQILARLP